MYEWENDLSKTNVLNRIHALKQEQKRITTTTLRGNFEDEEDKKYWEKKLKKITSELNALEQMK